MEQYRTQGYIHGTDIPNLLNLKITIDSVAYVLYSSFVSSVDSEHIYMT